MRCALVILMLLAASALAGPAQDFEQAKDLFRNKKDCGSAAPKLNNVLYPKEKLATKDDIFEARVMYGACLIEGGDREQAKAEFEKALQLKPNEILDSAFFSEPARRLFDDTKADVENRARKADEIRKLQAQREALEAYRKSLRVYRQNRYAVNFAPFGFGQLQNGDTRKFLLFGSGQLLTLGTSAGIWFYLVNKYGIRSDKVPPLEAERVLRLQQIEVATGVAFFALYGWSVFDALRNYEPQKRVEGDDALLDKAVNEQPKKTSLRERIHIVPMLSPDTVGIGIGWEN